MRTAYSLVIAVVLAISAYAQTYEFSYQGHLADNSLPANAVYDLEFRLFAAEAGGTVIAIQSRPNINVVGGSFTVKLDFGPQFQGQPRWLEIAVKPAGGPAYTTLAPRQPVTSAPYSIRSLTTETADKANNALQLAGVAASQYVLTTDPRLSDSRFIQNTQSPQSAHFNIDGNGTVGGTLTANNSLIGRNSLGGFAVFSYGNVGQRREDYGLPKAMIQYDNAIIRCFNGSSNVSTGNCGFTVVKIGPPKLPGADLRYLVDFGFDVSDRFIFVSASGGFVGVSQLVEGLCGNIPLTVNRRCLKPVRVPEDVFSSFLPFYLIVF